jgi:hypothetical protein
MSNTKKGRHRAPTTNNSSKARRRLAGIPILGWFTFAGAGVALAAWLILTGISGTVTTANIDVDYAANSGPVTVAAGNCTASYVGADEIALGWVTPIGGDSCTLSLEFAGNGNTVPVRPQDVTLPTGIIGNMGTACSTTDSVIPAGFTGTVFVPLTIEIDAATTNPGDVFTFSALTDGIEWVAETSFVPGNCPT